MINAEGAKGHQYADEFDYLAPTSPAVPAGAVHRARYARRARPEAGRRDHRLDLAHARRARRAARVPRRRARPDRRQRLQEARPDELGPAWIKPKAAENEFIYTMLGADCHMILCFRAKEKIKIVKGAEPIDLGWQPIAGERIAFETIFTLMLPPHSKGVPDLAISEMREPFDSMIP
jgi:hypothetical protein